MSQHWSALAAVHLLHDELKIVASNEVVVHLVGLEGGLIPWVLVSVGLLGGGGGVAESSGSFVGESVIMWLQYH